MDLHAIRLIAGQELLIHIRNKWILLFATVFAALSLAISYFGMVTVGETGFQGFTRTSASLLNLVLYLIPLIALSMGALSFSSEKGGGELLFSQPVSRNEILLGKLAGDFLSMAVATLLGFGLSGIVIAANAGSAGALRYPFFVLFSLLLSLIFLSLAALVSAACQRKTKSFGVALFVWFFFVLFYDLIVIGLTFLLKEHTANQVLFLSLFGNPVDMVRVATLIILDGDQIFGAAGAALLKFLGGRQLAVFSLCAALSLWIAIPTFLTGRLLKGQDI
jgi:Cu-processing system permease protein